MSAGSVVAGVVIGAVISGLVKAIGTENLMYLQMGCLAAAALIAGTLVVILDLVLPAGSIPLLITPARIILSVALLLVAAVLGCSFSLRRVLRIDPASAIGTTS